MRNRFSQGNQAAKKRRQRRGGRPSKLQAEVKRLAADLAKKYLESHMKPIMDAYISAASGEKCGRFKRKFDPPTCRHAVERFLGPAPRTFTLDLQDSIESFFSEVQAMEEGKTAEEGRS